MGLEFLLKSTHSRFHMIQSRKRPHFTCKGYYLILIESVFLYG